MAPIGNSPTWLTLEDMRKVVPLWLNLSIAVYQDKEAQKVRFFPTVVVVVVVAVVEVWW